MESSCSLKKMTENLRELKTDTLKITSQMQMSSAQFQ